MSASGAARVMGEAAARLASMERERNFMLTDADSEAADRGRIFGAGVLAGVGT